MRPVIYIRPFLLLLQMPMENCQTLRIRLREQRVNSYKESRSCNLWIYRKRKKSKKMDYLY